MVARQYRFCGHAVHNSAGQLLSEQLNVQEEPRKIYLATFAGALMYAVRKTMNLVQEKKIKKKNIKRYILTLTKKSEIDADEGTIRSTDGHC